MGLFWSDFNNDYTAQISFADIPNEGIDYLETVSKKFHNIIERK